MIWKKTFSNESDHKTDNDEAESDDEKDNDESDE